MQKSAKKIFDHEFASPNPDKNRIVPKYPPNGGANALYEHDKGQTRYHPPQRVHGEEVKEAPRSFMDYPMTESQSIRPRRIDFSKPLNQHALPDEDTFSPREDEGEHQLPKSIAEISPSDVTMPSGRGAKTHSSRKEKKVEGRVSVSNEQLELGKNLFEEFFVIGVKGEDVKSVDSKSPRTTEKQYLEPRVLYSYPSLNVNDEW
jgi:hypothetical protein